MNKSLIGNLTRKQAEMRKEASELRRVQVEKRVNFVQTLQDLYDANQVYCKDRTKLREEIIKNEDSIKKISFELQLLEKNFRKKDTLFTQYIQSLQKKVDDALKEGESYWNLNPALITEKDFESKLQSELLKIIKEKFYGEELFEKENIIKQYFIEIEKREQNLQELKFEELRIEKELFDLESKLKIQVTEIEKLGKEILLKESQFNDILYNREIIINTRVESRNNGLAKHLEAYMADDYEKYLKVNKNLYKQVLRKFSSFNYRSLSKSDKESFFELVIDDHSTKKNKYFDLIGQLINEEAVMESWEVSKDKLYKNNQKDKEHFENLSQEIKSLSEEIKLLNESKLELKAKMEMTLKVQINELQIEKNDLQVKHNVNVCKFKVKECSDKLEEYKSRLRKFEEEYEKGEEDFKGEMENLREEDKEIKMELIELGIYQSVETRPDMTLEKEEENKCDTTMTDYYNKNQIRPSRVSKLGKQSILHSLKSNKDDKSNSDSKHFSLIERSKSIDFTSTIKDVNDAFSQNEFVGGGLDDVHIVNKPENDPIPEETKDKEDPYFVNATNKVILILIIFLDFSSHPRN